jgi:hypothetical protein
MRKKALKPSVLRVQECGSDNIGVFTLAAKRQDPNFLIGPHNKKAQKRAVKIILSSFPRNRSESVN